MPRQARRRQLCICVAVTLVAACNSGGTECECPATGLTVNIPAPIAGPEGSINLSGLACAGAAVVPTAGNPRSTTQYRVQPTRPGPCSLDIVLADGTTFSDAVVVVETTGCCTGLRTDPLGAAEIDVPPPFDASFGDAG